MNLFRFAMATAMATYLLLLVGGTINPAGASLACPDWPTCYGTFFPEMKNGVQYEHTHRMVATAVGLMTLILAAWIWRSRPDDRGVRLLGLAAVALVVAQGVLGGITVLLKLPLFVSAAHLALSMVFFCLLIYLCFRLWPKTATEPVRPEPTAGPRKMVLLAGLLTLAQILVGALVRHTGAGGACGTDWLGCGGAFWPSFHPAQLHMAHRLLGYALFVVVVVAALQATRFAREHGRALAHTAALVSPLVALLQVALGLLTVRSGIGVVEAMGHLGGGALLLATLMVAYLGLGPLASRAAVSQAH